MAAVARLRGAVLARVAAALRGREEQDGVGEQGEGGADATTRYSAESRHVLRRYSREYQ